MNLDLKRISSIIVLFTKRRSYSSLLQDASVSAYVSMFRDSRFVSVSCKQGELETCGSGAIFYADGKAATCVCILQESAKRCDSVFPPLDFI